MSLEKINYMNHPTITKLTVKDKKQFLLIRKKEEVIVADDYLGKIKILNQKMDVLEEIIRYIAEYLDDGGFGEYNEKMAILLGKLDFHHGNIKKIRMGHFDNKDICWIVLKEDDEKTLVISEQAITKKQFHWNLFNSDWESSDLRKWMNNAFYQNCFEQSEKDSIIEGENGKIRLLNISEIYEYFSFTNSRKCTLLTALLSSPCSWWIKDDESTTDCAYVNEKGMIVRDGQSATLNNVGVRPAMWVKSEILESIEDI